MSKKKKQDKETTIENYYDLKVKDVDDLVAALKETPSTEPVTTDIKEITGEEVKGKSKKAKNFDPYRRDKLSAIPVWIKALFIKWWFAGCICYFFIMGLGIYIDQLDLMFIAGIGLGVVTDVFVNPIFRMLESDSKEFNAYMMFPFPFKAFWTFFTNVIYYVIVIVGVAFVFQFINRNMFAAPLEPLLFGTVCTVVDMIFIGIKDLIVFIVKRSKKKVSEDITDV